MEIKQRPAANLFFLRTEEGQQNEVARLTAPLGTLEKLPIKGGILLHMSERHSNPKGAWQEAQALLGKIAIAQPVLLDESGLEQYPTGEISVRFLNAPSDEQLKRFAESYGLRLRKRNEFVPQQAVFTPAEPGRQYLPELIQEIADSHEVNVVWANTLARYQRI